MGRASLADVTFTWPCYWPDWRSNQPHLGKFQHLCFFAMTQQEALTDPLWDPQPLEVPPQIAPTMLTISAQLLVSLSH